MGYSFLKRSALQILAIAICFSFLIEPVNAGYSRGPYLPTDAELSIPGISFIRADFSDRCVAQGVSCDPYSEMILMTTPPTATGATFEFGYILYDCQEIDDGAYGALACVQKGYQSVDTYRTCSTVRPTTTVDLTFQGQYCVR